MFNNKIYIPSNNIYSTYDTYPFSTKFNPYPASNLVDGNINTFVDITNYLSQGLQIYITLPRATEISRIIITNRLDCCQDSILDTVIRVKNLDNSMVSFTSIDKVANSYIYDLRLRPVLPASQIYIKESFTNTHKVSNNIKLLLLFILIIIIIFYLVLN